MHEFGDTIQLVIGPKGKNLLQDLFPQRDITLIGTSVEIQYWNWKEKDPEELVLLFGYDWLPKRLWARSLVPKAIALRLKASGW